MPVAKKQKTEKVEQLSGESACEAMLVYLEQQNRPYSPADISINLHNTISKSIFPFSFAPKKMRSLGDFGIVILRLRALALIYKLSSDIANATKLLKLMQDRGDIDGKVSGKQIIYYAKQVRMPFS
jgi:hypothetical protein